MRWRAIGSPAARAALGLALVASVLVLAVASCGRYGKPVRPVPEPAAADPATPDPAATDPGSEEAGEHAESAEKR